MKLESIRLLYERQPRHIWPWLNRYQLLGYNCYLPDENEQKRMKIANGLELTPDSNPSLPTDAMFLSQRDAQIYYDQCYERMVTYWKSHQDRDPREVFLGNPYGRNILDYGCGDGSLTACLTERNEVHGVDISPKMVQRARARGINARIHDGNTHPYLPYADETFDAIYVFDVLEHLFDLKILRELWRVMKPFGMMTVTVPVLKEHTMEQNVIFHHKTITALGETNHRFAKVEPEVGIKPFNGWIDAFSQANLAPATRAFGYTWEDNLNPEKVFWFYNNPQESGDVCLMLHKSFTLPSHEALAQLHNRQTASGGLSYEERTFTNPYRIAPSTLVI